MALCACWRSAGQEGWEPAKSRTLLHHSPPSPPAPLLCPAWKPWASPGWKVFIFDAVVAPQWLNQKSLGCQNGWEVVFWGLSYSCAYWEAYGLGSDCCIRGLVGGWSGLGEPGGGYILDPCWLSHPHPDTSWMGKANLLINSSHSTLQVPTNKPICHQPHAQNWIFIPLT